MTLVEAGAVLGLSRERVRQIEAKAVAKLARHHPQWAAEQYEALCEREGALTPLEAVEREG